MLLVRNIFIKNQFLDRLKFRKGSCLSLNIGGTTAITIIHGVIVNATVAATIAATVAAADTLICLTLQYRLSWSCMNIMNIKI